MRIKFALLSVAYFCITGYIQGQTVGIGTTTPNKNAILDVTVPDASNPQGMLLPRLKHQQDN